MCGIPKTTIEGWALEAGIRSELIPATREATLTVMEQRKLKREVIRGKLLDRIEGVLDRFDAEHIDYKGSAADKVTFPTAPAAAVRDYSQAIATLLREYRLETGEAGDRSESTTRVGDLVRNDHEQKLLENLIRAGMELEQAPPEAQ